MDKFKVVYSLPNSCKTYSAYVYAENFKHAKQIFFKKRFGFVIVELSYVETL